MNRFLAGADSVFSFLTGMVEYTEAGCRWRTYDYCDKPQYHYCILNDALGYKVTTSAGDRWPSDTSGLYSQDFSYGASGTGYFFLGIVESRHHVPPLVQDRPHSAAGVGGVAEGLRQDEERGAAGNGGKGAGRSPGSKGFRRVAESGS